MSSSSGSTNDKRTFNSVHEAFEDFSDKVGGGTICSAKWLQTTLHLYNGTTQSCHHCPAYKIDPIEVTTKPSLLHNIPIKVEQRKGMREGKKDSDCTYCWKAESLGAVSDRMTKSTSPEWSIPGLERIKEDEPFPTYLEVALDSTCNLACAYCGPVNSSKWMEDIKRHGEYTKAKGMSLKGMESSDLIPIPQNQPNSYRDAFWQWWPELYESLHVFRITGGEPLLSKTAWRVMEYINDKPRKDLIFGINTNMSVEPIFIDRLVEFCASTEDNLKKMQVYTSCEAHGEQAEYIRDGLNYEVFFKNINQLMSGTKKTTLTMMMTLNALSVFSLDKFLNDLFDLCDKYPGRIAMDFVCLRHPRFMDVRILEKRVRVMYLDNARRIVEARGSEMNKVLFDRFYRYAMDDFSEEERQANLWDFRDFFEEYDLRRGKSLYGTFPELL